MSIERPTDRNGFSPSLSRERERDGESAIMSRGNEL